nr:unnamed protein product [Callosobruchus chinensis]
MAVLDADYKFVKVDIGAMGRFSNGNVFASSGLGKKMMRHTLQFPHLKVFVGDEAFPLSINLMRPYPRTHVTGNYEHQVFNARLSQARQTAECAFGILSARFRVFKRPFENKEDTVKDVVKAACVLHNYLLPSVIMENVNDTEKRSKTQLLHVQGSTMRTSSAAFRVRQNFTTYFKNWGAVPWQHQSVLLGKY